MTEFGSWSSYKFDSNQTDSSVEEDVLVFFFAKIGEHHLSPPGGANGQPSTI